MSSRTRCVAGFDSGDSILVLCEDDVAVACDIALIEVMLNRPRQTGQVQSLKGKNNCEKAGAVDKVQELEQGSACKWPGVGCEFGTHGEDFKCSLKLMLRAISFIALRADVKGSKNAST